MLLNGFGAFLHMLNRRIAMLLLDGLNRLVIKTTLDELLRNFRLAHCLSVGLRARSG